MADITVPDFTVHEPNSWCGNIHCHSCGIDELAHGAYQVCGECGHVYPTARSLRRAYRRVVWEMIRNPLSGTRWFTNDWATGRFRQTFAMLTVRASKIYFCQLCIHDF